MVSQGIEHVGWRRNRRLQHQIVTIDHYADARGPRQLENFGGAHSRALQPGAPVFSGADWGGGFASASSAAVPALAFNGLARKVAPLPLPLPSAWPATVRRSGASKPLVVLGSDLDVDGADG